MHSNEKSSKQAQYIIESIKSDFSEYVNIESKYYPDAFETAITCYYKSGVTKPDKCRTMCKIWIHDEYNTNDIQISDVIYWQMKKDGEIDNKAIHHIATGFNSGWRKDKTYLCLEPYYIDEVIDVLYLVLKAYKNFV